MQQSRPKGKIIIGLIVMFFVVGVGNRMMGNTAPRGTTSSNTVATSGEHLLSAPGGAAVIIAADDQAMTELLKAANAGDKVGLAELAVDGKVWTVPSGTRALVLSATAFGRSEVRILDGNAFGKRGWVPSERVQ